MTTTIEAELGDKLKAAMRAGDRRATSAYRMLRTKIMEARTAKNAKPLDDDAILDIIRGYVKSLDAALIEYRANGTDEGDDNVAQLAAEVALLDPYMPKFLSEDATAALVEATIAATGATSRKEAGKVMGVLMRDHKGTVDPGVVRRLVEARLA